MSQANELLDNLTEEIVEPAGEAGTTPEERHIVIGRDRFITVPEELKKIAVQFDHDIETVTFDCPRYWDEHDMSKMKVYVNYVRADGKPGTCLCTNVVVDETDSELMHFDWTISGNVTFAAGGLVFLVCIKRTDPDGNEENHWNSELCTDTYVSQGLRCMDLILRRYPDIITQLLERMDEAEETVTIAEQSAAESAASAKASEECAKTAATQATEAAESAANAETSAKESAESAKASEESANIAINIATEAAASAKASEESAANAEASAKESAESAKASEANTTEEAMLGYLDKYLIEGTTMRSVIESYIHDYMTENDGFRFVFGSDKPVKKCLWFDTAGGETNETGEFVSGSIKPAYESLWFNELSSVEVEGDTSDNGSAFRLINNTEDATVFAEIDETTYGVDNATIGKTATESNYNFEIL